MKLCGTRTILSLNSQVTFLQQQIAVLLVSKSPSIVFVDCSKLPYSRYLTLLFVFIQFSVCLVTITSFILAAVLYHPISDNGLKFINTKCTIYNRISKQSYIFTGTRSLIFIAPAYSRVRYRSSNFRPYVRSSVRSSVNIYIEV